MLFFPMFFVLFYAKLHVNGRRWKGAEMAQKRPGQESNLRPSA
jgi:hypothetical protein